MRRTNKGQLSNDNNKGSRMGLYLEFLSEVDDQLLFLTGENHSLFILQFSLLDTSSLKVFSSLSHCVPVIRSLPGSLALLRILSFRLDSLVPSGSLLSARILASPMSCHSLPTGCGCN